MFIDKVTIRIESGSGGNGMVAWRREKFVPNGGPAGGDGGRGGSVYLKANSELNTLLEFQYLSVYKAQNGEKGHSKNMHGRGGEDLIIQVPCGTVVTDVDSGLIIADLTDEGQTVLVASGGRGGRGNARFMSANKQAPYFAEPGETGIARTLQFELKLIAQVGLIGLPNAGKSTLISVISAAKPKIANYPFTTLVPNLGVVRRPNGDGVVFADIPGLVEGASEGIGLGHAFLRHVERTRLLVHLVDGTELEYSVLDAFRMINHELSTYSVTFSTKPQIVVLTKTDAVHEADLIQLREQFMAQNPHVTLHIISALNRQGIDALLSDIWTQLDALPPPEPLTFVIAEDEKATQRDDASFEVIPCRTFFEVKGERLVRLMQTTDMTHPVAMNRLMNIYKSMGVFDALVSWGAQPGDTVRISGVEFTYDPDAYSKGGF